MNRKPSTRRGLLHRRHVAGALAACRERTLGHALGHLLLHGTGLSAPVPVLVSPARDEQEQRDERRVRVIERGMHRDGQPTPERSVLVRDKACHITRARRARRHHNRRY